MKSFYLMARVLIHVPLLQRCMLSRCRLYTSYLPMGPACGLVSTRTLQRPVSRLVPQWFRAGVLCCSAITSACVVDLAQLPSEPHEIATLQAGQVSEPLDQTSGTYSEPTDRRGPVADSRQTLDNTTEKTLPVEQQPHRSGSTAGRLPGIAASAAGGEPADLPKESLLSIDALDTPVHSVLYTLARDAGVSLHIIGELTGRVTLRNHQSALPVLLDRLAEQAGFNWDLNAQNLTVMAGGFYTYSYPVNYLNINRMTRSTVGLATQVGTINAADDAVGSIANSSRTQVENQSEHRYWASLHADIEGLLDGYEGPGVSAEGGSKRNSAEHRFSINREAGLLTVSAASQVHHRIRRYLALLNDRSRRQVLIEATVVEVTLSDSYQAGVDWQALATGLTGLSAAQVLTGSPVLDVQSASRLTTPSGLISLVQESSNHNVSATLSLMEQFGDVRILSRPRVIALNNQTSVLKVVDNKVYFTVSVQRRQSDKVDQIETETEIHTVPVGLVMQVTPQIGDGDEVMLNVRPTLSRILGFVNDPNPELAQANVRNGVPEIQVREMETLLQVASGNVAILGGLMQESHADTQSGLPVLRRIRGLGHLFSSQSRTRRQTELMIMIKPSVIKSSTRVAGR